MILPWQTKEWQIFRHAVCANRLPHALLLTGITGVGKKTFADCITRSLLCGHITEDGFACNNCHACRLISGKVHPNILLIEPDNGVIKVDQIRTINEFLQHTALNGIHRIVMIHKAPSMNINAANALLKILEEPSANALLILLSENERLPITIKSRCQRLTFGVPSKEQALTWLMHKLPASTEKDAQLLLSLAQGAPLEALRLANDQTALQKRFEVLSLLSSLKQKQIDPVQSARVIQEMDMHTFVDIALSWVIDLLRCQSMLNAYQKREASRENARDPVYTTDEDMLVAHLCNKDFSAQLKELAQQITSSKIVRLMDCLQQFRTYMSVGVNLNKQLMLENILIRWVECG